MMLRQSQPPTRTVRAPAPHKSLPRSGRAPAPRNSLPRSGRAPAPRPYLAAALALISHFSLLTSHSSPAAISQLSLASTNDYLWCTGACPYRIVGYGSGSVATNLVDRGEDMAFLAEARLERLYIPISSETYDYDPASHLNKPFPQLAEELDSNILNPWYWMMSDFKDRGLGNVGNFISCVYDESQLVTSMRDCGPYFQSDIVEAEENYVASNMFQSCKINAPRQPIYLTNGTNQMQRYILRGDRIFGLYKDLHDNQGLCFYHSCHGNVGSVSVVDDEHEGFENASPGWGTITPQYYHRTSRYADTNRSDTVIYPQWTLGYSGTKQHQAHYDGQSLACEHTFEHKTISEHYTLAVSNTVIRFHGYMSNRIDRLKTFAAFRVRRFVSTSVTNQYKTVVSMDKIILAPVTATPIAPAPDGGPRYAVGVDMPRMAHDVADFTGVAWPTDTFASRFSALEDPPLPTPPAGATYRNVYSKQNSIEDVLFVRLLKVCGIAKVIYHAKEIRN